MSNPTKKQHNTNHLVILVYQKGRIKIHQTLTCQLILIQSFPLSKDILNRFNFKLKENLK